MFGDGNECVSLSFWERDYGRGLQESVKEQVQIASTESDEKSIKKFLRYDISLKISGDVLFEGPVNIIGGAT